MVHMVSEEALSPQTQQLDVKCVGGGNIVRYRPVFSPDSSTIFVVKGNVIEAYNVKTGARLQDYTGLESPAIGVQLHPNDEDVLVACSDEGELISWKINTQLPGKTVVLNKPTSAAGWKFRGFQLILTTKVDGSEKCDVFTTLSPDPSEDTISIIFCSTSGSVLKEKLDFVTDKHSHSFSFGGDPGARFLATISHNLLTVAYTSNIREPFYHRVDELKAFTCVTCHQHRQLLVTGLSTGRILVWTNFMSHQAIRSFCHWHQFPVQDIIFSENGSHFYSGAEECVLVKWDTKDMVVRQFVPRMSAQIAHVAIAPNNLSVAVSTVDNALSFVNAQMFVTSTIQSLTWGVMTGLEVAPLAAGIHVSPRDGTLVLNGRVGHLQFFDPIRKALDFNLDITCQNYLTQEVDRMIVNTAVVAMAIDTDGTWMATVEERDDHETTPESRIKFWMYDFEVRSFTLDTTVERPHDGATTAVEFRPAQGGAKSLAATLGTDRKFRVWTLVSVKLPGKPASQMWGCESVGFYKSLQPGALGFSEDGSLLAVSFACTLTVWTPVTCETKCSLTHPTTRAHIRQVEFGRKECCHLVATASDTTLCVWNLLSLSMAWTVDVGVALLVADPLSSAMAVFSTQNELFVFSPLSCQPLYRHEAVAPHGAAVLKAVFRPRRDGARQAAGWQAASQLFYITENQDVLCLEDPAAERQETHLEVMQPSTKRRLTPFAALMAQHSVSDVKKLMPVKHKLHGTPGQQAVTEFLAAPCHTMPSLSVLCGEFLRSFTTSSENYKVEENSTQLSERDVDDDNLKIEQLGNKLKETRVSEADSAVLDLQLDQILKENLNWVEMYGINT